jgi:hypothetical protein
MPARISLLEFVAAIHSKSGGFALLNNVLFPKYRKNRLISKKHLVKLEIKKVLPKTKKRMRMGRYYSSKRFLEFTQNSVQSLNILFF